MMHFVSGILAGLGAISLLCAAALWSERKSETMGMATAIGAFLFLPAGALLLIAALIAWLI